MTTKRLPADHNPETTVLPFAEGRGHYNANIAKTFFKTFGKKESFDEGHVFFALNEKSRKRNIFQKPLTKALFTKLDRDLFRRKNIHRMYLLTKGEVTLKVKQRLLDRAHAGDIFGEMAVISEIPDIDVEMPRSATAKAVAAGVAYSLDGAETEAYAQAAGPARARGRFRPGRRSDRRRPCRGPTRSPAVDWGAVSGSPTSMMTCD